jgi:hypothetical protein
MVPTGETAALVMHALLLARRLLRHERHKDFCLLVEYCPPPEPLQELANGPGSARICSTAAGDVATAAALAGTALQLHRNGHAHVPLVEQDAMPVRLAASWQDAATEVVDALYHSGTALPGVPMASVLPTHEAPLLLGQESLDAGARADVGEPPTRPRVPVRAVSSGQQATRNLRFTVLECRLDNMCHFKF